MRSDAVSRTEVEFWLVVWLVGWFVCFKELTDDTRPKHNSQSLFCHLLWLGEGWTRRVLGDHLLHLFFSPLRQSQTAHGPIPTIYDDGFGRDTDEMTFLMTDRWLEKSVLILCVVLSCILYHTTFTWRYVFSPLNLLPPPTVLYYNLLILINWKKIGKSPKSLCNIVLFNKLFTM